MEQVVKVSGEPLRAEAVRRHPTVDPRSPILDPRSSLHGSCLLPALATGGMLGLCHFPVAFSWLAWLALVPLLSLVRSEARPLRIYLSTLAGGLAFYVPALQWMRVAHPMMYFTWIGLAIYCSLFLLAAMWLLRRLDRRSPLPLVLTVPAVWTALEFLRSFLLSGFPWYYLAHSQHDFLPLIQVSDLAGAYAVTFVVAAVNALLFELLFACEGVRRLFALPDAPVRWGRPALAMQVGAVGVLLGAVLAYGFLRLGQEDFQAGPRVALIQGNLPQAVRNARHTADGGSAGQSMSEHYGALCAQARLQNPDLIVWPETSYPLDWEELSPDFPEGLIKPEYRKGDSSDWRVNVLRKLNERLLQDARVWQTDVLLGLNCQVVAPDQRVCRYNSAVLVQADGSPAGRYDKMHRVPFGEYVPLRDALPFLERFAPYDFDYSVEAGQHFTRFPLGQYRFGVLICYEDSDPVLARQYVRSDSGGPPVDFLVNISNDGWFDGTSEHEEHLAICRFRAVETRRAVARAVNMGISAVIDGSGRVVALPRPMWGQSKKVEGVVTATIPLDCRSSRYAVWGDWLPWGCWLVIGVGLLYAFIGPKPL
jgi:apolipoprotein N-acyltransferase